MLGRCPLLRGGGICRRAGGSGRAAAAAARRCVTVVPPQLHDARSSLRSCCAGTLLQCSVHPLAAVGRAPLFSTAAHLGRCSTGLQPPCAACWCRPAASHVAGRRRRRGLGPAGQLQAARHRKLGGGCSELLNTRVPNQIPTYAADLTVPLAIRTVVQPFYLGLLLRDTHRTAIAPFTAVATIELSFSLLTLPSLLTLY